MNLLLADDTGRRRRIAYVTTAFAHALAGRLRGRIVALMALPWLDKRQREQLGQRENVPDALLAMIAAELAQALRSGELDPILYTQLEERLHAMSSIQAGCERILTTPLPFAYTLLLHRCAWMFCVLLPFGLASSLGWGTPVPVGGAGLCLLRPGPAGRRNGRPFGLEPNDLPLDALVRTIEIDQLDALGERPLPEPLLPQGYLLQ